MKKNITALLIAFIMLLSVLPVPAAAASSGVMIYEVYSSGGYASDKNEAPYKNCYIVLYNASGSDVSLSGWSIRVAGGTSNTIDAASTVNLSGTIDANKYYVIKGGVCADHKGTVYGRELDFNANLDAPNLKLYRKAGKIALCSGGGDTQLSSRGGSVVDF